jgi:hypothetical protein
MLAVIAMRVYAFLPCVKVRKIRKKERTNEGKKKINQK